MVMHSHQTRLRAVPQTRDAPDRSISDKVRELLGNAWTVMAQRIESVGVSTTVVSIIGGLISLGIVAVVSLQWSNSIAIARIEEHQISTDSSLSEIKHGLEDGRWAPKGNP